MEKPLTKENELNKTCPYMSNTVLTEEGEVEVLLANCVGKKCALWYDYNSNYGKCLAASSAEGQTHTYLRLVERQNDGS